MKSQKKLSIHKKCSQNQYLGIDVLMDPARAVIFHPARFSIVQSYSRRHKVRLHSKVRPLGIINTNLHRILQRKIPFGIFRSSTKKHFPLRSFFRPRFSYGHETRANDQDSLFLPSHKKGFFLSSSLALAQINSHR